MPKSKKQIAMDEKNRLEKIALDAKIDVDATNDVENANETRNGAIANQTTLYLSFDDIDDAQTKLDKFSSKRFRVYKYALDAFNVKYLVVERSTKRAIIVENRTIALKIARFTLETKIIDFGAKSTIDNCCAQIETKRDEKTLKKFDVNDARESIELKRDKIVSNENANDKLREQIAKLEKRIELKRQNATL